MNNGGQALFIGLMLGTVIIILAFALAPVLKESNDIAMNSTDSDSLGLDCSNQSISDFNKAGCVATDMTTPLFIATLIGLGLVVIAAKFFGGLGG
jgi:hypothetical protein